MRRLCVTHIMEWRFRMTTLSGHFDGKYIVLDQPPPASLRPNDPVTVVFGNGASSNGEAVPAAPIFDALLDLAAPRGLPADFAAQHEHYVKGLPKR
jgi:hypothetical protein